MSGKNGKGRAATGGKKSALCKTVMVTGAGGYVGRILTRQLAESPGLLERIVATDLRVPPKAEQLPGVTYEALDVCGEGLADQLRAHGVDAVVHLAAIVTPQPGQGRDLQYKVDVEGTENMLAACVEAGVGKFIVTSSGAAYGYHADGDRMLYEDAPLRGNEAFAYAHHKRLVEGILARYREEHPELAQLIFRVGTILGESVSNQITALFEKKVVLGLKDVPTPFVFIWDEDVAGVLAAGVHGDGAGIYNLAGDGTMTLKEIARRLGKRFVPLPVEWITGGLSLLKKLGLTQYGPEQVRFLRYRPVLANDKLKHEFGYQPRLSSKEVFELYARGVEARRG